MLYVLVNVCLVASAKTFNLTSTSSSFNRRWMSYPIKLTMFFLVVVLELWAFKCKDWSFHSISAWLFSSQKRSQRLHLVRSSLLKCLNIWNVWRSSWIVILGFNRSGFINLDKPANPSSHEVISLVTLFVQQYVRVFCMTITITVQ